MSIYEVSIEFWLSQPTFQQLTLMCWLRIIQYSVICRKCVLTHVEIIEIQEPNIG